MDNLEYIVNKALSRRGFMAGAGSVAAVSLVAGCSDDSTVALPVTSVSYTDTDILNFALNTEYLEAEFYLRAATGAGLPTALQGSNPGAVNAPATTKVTTQYNGAALTTAQQNILNEIAYTEQQHVATLRSALGSAAVSRPAIDLVAGFNGVVTAANAISSTAAPTIPAGFSPFQSFDAFALVSGGFEDLGVTAYSGAAPLISAAGIQAGLLAAAGGILAKEAYSAGMMRAYLTGNSITLGSTTYPYAGYFNRLGLVYKRPERHTRRWCESNLRSTGRLWNCPGHSGNRNGVAGRARQRQCPGSLPQHGSGPAHRLRNLLAHFRLDNTCARRQFRWILPQRPQRQHQSNSELRTSTWQIRKRRKWIPSSPAAVRCSSAEAPQPWLLWQWPPKPTPQLP